MHKESRTRKWEYCKNVIHRNSRENELADNDLNRGRVCNGLVVVITVSANRGAM